MSNTKKDSTDMYDERFNQYQVEEMELLGKSPQQANSYDTRFNGDAVTWLLKVDCPNEIAIKYDNRFTGKSVFKIFNEGISYEIANKYDPRFSTPAIIELYHAGILPDAANSMQSERFSMDDMIELFKKKCPLDLAEQYPGRFAAWEIGHLNKAGCSPQDSDKYNSKFSGRDIANFLKNKITHETAAKYNKNQFKFDAHDIMELEKYGCDPETANEYEDFYSKEIIQLYRMGCFHKTANTFRKRFEPEVIVELVKLKCSFEEADKYNSDRFSGEHVIRLIKTICPPETANSYDKRFTGEEVVYLAEAKIDPEKAQKYDSKLKGPHIVILARMEYSPEKLKELDDKEKENIYAVSDSIVKDILQPENLIHFDFKLIAVGSTAAILLKDNKAYKYSTPDNIDGEFRIFEKLEDKKFKYIIKYLGVKKDQNTPLHPLVSVIIRDNLLDKLALELEYIDGDTLEKIIEKDGVLPSSKVLKYGFGILKGIEELHNEFLFHRDLHDRNIMIHSDTDQPVIIDLGTVVTMQEQYNVHDLNRAFGGNNDLISLGQLMYKMATGNNLFLDQDPRGLSKSEIKNKIKARREEVYFNADLKQQYFEKVKQTVNGDFVEIIAELIVYLLDDDLWVQPPQVKFYEKYNHFINAKKKMLRQLFVKKCKQPGHSIALNLFEVGVTSMLLTADTRAWKFSLSENIDRQIEHFEKLKGAKYVASVKGIQKYNQLPIENPGISDILKDFAADGELLEMENIGNETLETIIKREKKLPVEKILAYGPGILKGIKEIHQKHLSHDCLDDRTIMIDSHSQQPRIVDLGGVVKTDSYLFNYNNSYGGGNDLISLGLLLYKMASGENLFNEGPRFIKHIFWNIRPKIKDVYDDSQELEEYFNRIKKNVPEILADIIIFLMDRDLNQNLSIEIFDDVQAKLYQQLLFP